MQTLLGQSVENMSKEELAGSAVWLWMSLVATGLVLIIVTWALVSRHRRRVRQRLERPRQGTRHKDAWAEAGKRVEAITIDEEPKGDGA